jgi:uncharacterized protein YdhG (YjbR/CyaY superfamily)
VAGPSSVEEYLAGLPDDQRGALERLRRQIAAAAPGAVEAISYGMPTFVLDRRGLVSFAAFNHHCSLFAGRGMVTGKLGEELRPYASGRSTLRFTDDEPIPAALVRRIVKARVREIGAAAPAKRRVRR